MATANVDVVELRDHHEHPLTLVAEAGEFECSGCKEHGYDGRYACRSRQCSRGRAFHLHKACAKPFGSSLRHPLKRGNLLFRRSPSQPDHPCRGCGRQVTGYAYERERRRLLGCILLERGTVLHPCCAALPASIERAAPVIPVRLELKRRLKSRCTACEHVRFEGKRTWGYVSADEVYQIHVACANRRFREEYEAARLRNPDMLSRLREFLRNTLRLSSSTVNGCVTEVAQLPGTGGEAENGAAGVLRNALSTIGAIGAIITAIGGIS